MRNAKKNVIICLSSFRQTASFFSRLPLSDPELKKSAKQDPRCDRKKKGNMGRSAVMVFLLLFSVLASSSDEVRVFLSLFSFFFLNWLPETLFSCPMWRT